MFQSNKVFPAMMLTLDNIVEKNHFHLLMLLLYPKIP